MSNGEIFEMFAGASVWIVIICVAMLIRSCDREENYINCITKTNIPECKELLK